MNALEIKGLKKIYSNGVEALKGIDLTIESGDFFALLGANGAGKTTIIGIVTSLVNKSAGTVKVFGIDIDQDFSAAKAMIGVVPQEFNFNIFQKVQDILLDQAGYYGVPADVALPRSEEVLKNLGLWEKRNEKSQTLSGGMKRRLMIARALMHDPKLLILDEPTAGVDVELRHGMWEYLKRINAAGTTILLTTHYLEEVEQLCRNAAIMHKGEVIRNDSVKNLLSVLEKEYYTVTVSKTAGAENVSGFDITIIDHDTLEVGLPKGQSVTDLTSALHEAGIVTVSMRPKGNRLEGLFLDLVKK
ncbi:MAG: ABC transporter ATP-binding protein [Patescibacteria group bacterium]